MEEEDIKEEIKEKFSKYRKLAESVRNMKKGDCKSPTNLSKGIVHKNTAEELLNFEETMSQIGHHIQRDNEGKIKFIVRTDDNLEIRSDIREIKRTILRGEKNVEGLKEDLIKILKNLEGTSKKKK